MRMKSLSFLVAAPLILASCGDDSGSKNAGAGSTAVTSGSMIQSQFIDAPVKGLEFSAVSGNGKTVENGHFDCVAGEKVTFSIKGLEIGSANCGDKIYISEMTPSTLVPYTLWSAAIIQTFAQYDGTTLDLEAVNGDSEIDLSTVDLSLESDIDGAIKNLAQSSTSSAYEAKTIAQAESHVNQHLPNQSNNSILEAAYEATQGEAQYIHLKLTKGTKRDCSENIIAEVILDKKTVGERVVYKLSVPRSVEFDNFVDADQKLDNPFEQCEFTDCSTGLSPRYLNGNSVVFYDHKVTDRSVKQENDVLCYGKYTDEEGTFNYHYFIPKEEAERYGCDGTMELTQDYDFYSSDSMDATVRFTAGGVQFNTNVLWKDYTITGFTNNKIKTGTESGTCSYSATQKF